MAILGVSTNTRLLGLAVIQQERLIDYSIHLHKSPWSTRKADKILAHLEPCVRRYSITRVVLSIPHAYHQTKAFRFLVACFRRYCAGKHLPLVTQPAAALPTLCQAQQAKTRKALMHTLCLRYPELRYYYLKELRNRRSYYHKLFDAIGVALLTNEDA